MTAEQSGFRPGGDATTPPAASDPPLIADAAPVSPAGTPAGFGAQQRSPGHAGFGARPQSPVPPGFGASPRSQVPPGFGLPPNRWPAPGTGHTPSGLFPSRGPRRPTYREPHQVRPGPLAAGMAAGAVWLALFALLAGDLRGLGWWTIFAGAVAWLVAVVLARLGDRGVAAGLAVSVAVGWGTTATLIALRWADTSDWPLW